MANKQGPSFLATGNHDATLNRVVSTFLLSLEHNATAQVQKQAMQLIALAEKAAKPTLIQKLLRRKADRYVKDQVSFADGGDAALQLTSSLNSSRLAVWGFTAEADVLGITTYQLTAVLDGRTSAFCRAIDGKTFDVQSAKDKINQVLSVQDPNDLKSVQPWPGQSKEEVAAYAEMSGEELAALGLNIPPFHPNCRTLLVGVDDEVSSPAPRMEAPDTPDSEAGTVSTRESFEEIGVNNLTDAQIDHWNSYIRLDPAALIADFVGITPEQVIDGELETHTIKVDYNGNITFEANKPLEDGKVKVSAVIDPYTGTVYSDQADFVNGDDDASEDFLVKLYGGLITTGQNIGATTLAVNSGNEAYTYAKLGFAPNALDWQHLRADILDSLEGDQKDVMDDLTPDQQSFLINLLGNNNEASFQVLADLPWSYKGQPLAKELLESHRDLTMRLDLTDEDAVARAEAYLGG